MNSRLLHGTAIALASSAALIRGPSGSGKSDLALRCLGLSAGALIRHTARLVADDQVVLAPAADAMGMSVYASAPASLRGKLEVRGVGIVEIPAIESARLALVVDLVLPERVERMPERRSCTIETVELPRIELNPFEGSAPLKLLLSLQQFLS